jgi:hypothetical protein
VLWVDVSGMTLDAKHVLDSDVSWQRARLIPVSGINGAEEQERRATSALLAVLSSVKEFGRTLTRPYGAPAGPVETFIEVPFKVGDKKVYPDGLIRVTRGKTTWTALLEVKTNKNELHAEQIENYLTVANEHGFDAVITISNEIPAVPGQHPTAIDKKKLKKVALHHLPWSQVLAEAVLQKEHRGVADPDQAWILSELIRYLEHGKSGALDFDDMGSHWVPVRDAIKNGTIRSTDVGVTEVASRFDALLRFASLQLGKRLGEGVSQALTRRDLADPTLRTMFLTGSLCDHGTMSGALRIQNAVANLQVTADLRAGQVTCFVDVDAPKEGRATTRVNWLLRQLKDAPENLRVEATVSRGVGAAELLHAVRENPDALVLDPNKEIRGFRIALTTPMGTKRGAGKGGFIDSVIDAINTFYSEVVQHLKAWVPAAPKMRELPGENATDDDTTADADLSSQDSPTPFDEPEMVTLRVLAWGDSLTCNRFTVKELTVPVEEHHLYAALP